MEADGLEPDAMVDFGILVLSGFLCPGELAGLFLGDIDLVSERAALRDGGRAVIRVVDAKNRRAFRRVQILIDEDQTATVWLARMCRDLPRGAAVLPRTHSRPAAI